MTLQEKILHAFEGKVVRKDLTARVKGNAVVPTYVLEYLLGQYCAINDDELINTGVEKVKGIIQNNYVHRSEAEIIKSRIREVGQYKIIDKINVSLNDRENIYEAELANLGLKQVPISDYIVKNNQKLLSGAGVWSILTMDYNHADGLSVRWVINDLKPIQVSNVSLDEYISKRKEFEADEWLDLLMLSIGLTPDTFTKRGKFIQVSRLLTHVENNFNFIELGPKGTGKSHIFSELSPHGVLVSGGDVSKARLFVNNNGNKIGLVGFWDVIALDEFEQEVGGKRVDDDLVKIMQNYMANQSFNRGKETFQATASIALVGNTKRTVPYMLKHSHLFESIPTGYIKGAFLDRMHLYSPGWEVKILKESVFSTGFGFIVDYLAEICRELRRLDFSHLIDSAVELDGSLTKRDKLAIRKTFSGMVKLLYPDGQLTEAQLLELLDYAMEGRKRVKDQLYIIDETFRDEPTNFHYKIKSSGRAVEVETLEKVNYKTEVAQQETDDQSVSPIQGGDTPAPTATSLPNVNQIVIRDNQTGISYKRLFGDHLKGAKTITLIDPYIRQPYQFRNLVEFCVMLAQVKEPDEEVSLKVITWNDIQYMQTSIYNFEEITTSVAELGILLTHEFEDLHDRAIKTDTGWKITLGRGLDIFEPREGRFNVADSYQEKRKCKNCEITYIRKVDMSS